MKTVEDYETEKVKNKYIHISGDKHFTDPPQNCFKQRQRALKTSNETGIPVFVPVCRDDGSFVEVQCFYGTGYCWCVNDSGKPVPGTSIQYERPKCRVKSRRKRLRRGKKPRPARPNSKGIQRRKGPGFQIGPKACIQADRSEFNTQVTNLIMSEFRNINGAHSIPEGVDHRRYIIEWKFDNMDRDRLVISKLFY